MLIRFTLENFLSFRDRETFSMIPGKGTLKANHKSKPVNGVSTLKTGIVFGANASGKSNLIKALNFGQKFIILGNKPNTIIDYQKFRLDAESQKGDSRFEFEIQNKGKNYAYGFIFNKREIVEEWLYEIGKNIENKIFERKKDLFDLENISAKNSNDEKQFLEFSAKATPGNTLFLTEIINRRIKANVSNIEDLLNVSDWFLNSLNIIFPEDKYDAGTRFQIKNNTKIQTVFQELLNYFDTGIDGVCFKEIKADSIGMPTNMLEALQLDLEKSSAKDRGNAILLVSPEKETFFFTKKNDELKVEKFMTTHKVKGRKKEEIFDTTDESDGTNRIIDFIPLIIDLLDGDKVFIIDEMERSLHPNLIYDIIDLFLEKSENINSQIIVASHESSLLTQKLLRKDEIWFVVKDKDGGSKLHSLEEYNIRFDKKIRKDYLMGRFKAIPRLGNRNTLTVLPSQIK